jgi:hypothetical protein
MMLDQLPQLGLGDVADNFHDRDVKYGKTTSMVLAVIELHTDDVAAAPAATTFGELMECLDIIHRISQIPQKTC